MSELKETEREKKLKQQLNDAFTIINETRNNQNIKDSLEVFFNVEPDIKKKKRMILSIEHILEKEKKKLKIK